MRFFFICLVVISPHVCAKEFNSFEDFFTESLQKNDLYLSSFLDEESAKFRKEGTVGLYLPTLTASYLKSESESDFSKDSSRTATLGLNGSLPHLGVSYGTTIYSDTETLRPRPIQHQGNYNFDISVDLIKNFGGKVTSLPFKEADLSLDLARITKMQSIYSLFQDLLQTFSQAFASQKNMKVTEQSEKRNKEELSRAMAQYKAGKIPKLSLLSLQSQYQQMRGQLIGQERSLLSSFQSLYTLAGLEEKKMDNDSVRAELIPIKMPFFDEAIINQLLKRKINFSQLKNPEYLAGVIRLRQSEINVVRAKEDILPAVSLSYTHSGSSNNTNNPDYFPNEIRGNTIALNLSMPIGFVSERNELAAVRNSLRSSELSLMQLQRKLTRVWENLSNQYTLLKKQLEISNELVIAAKERYEASQVTAGLGSTYQQNIIIFQNEWIQSELDLNQLQVELIVTQFQILAFHGHPHILRILNTLKKGRG